MNKKILILLLMMAVVGIQAQSKTKKPKEEEVNLPEPEKSPIDSLMGYAMYEGMTPFAALDYQLPPESETDPVTGKKTVFKAVIKKNDSIRAAFRKEFKKRNMVFYARTQKPRKIADKMKLCINIVSKDTNLTYCVVDSFCRNPEIAKVLFEKQNKDTTYMLIYVEAFSKTGGSCDGQKEAKLLFVRWNTVENRAIWRTKYVSSCAKTITDMSKSPIVDWDKNSNLLVSYHRGSKFYDIFFDPKKPELGIQKGTGGSDGADD